MSIVRRKKYIICVMFKFDDQKHFEINFKVFYTIGLYELDFSFSGLTWFGIPGCGCRMEKSSKKQHRF